MKIDVSDYNSFKALSSILRRFLLGGCHPRKSKACLGANFQSLFWKYFNPFLTLAIISLFASVLTYLKSQGPSQEFGFWFRLIAFDTY